MKNLKSLFVLIIFAVGASMNAQTATITEWKELASVKEVIERIHSTSSQGDAAPLKHFSQTLFYATTAMVNSKVPAAYKNAKRQTAIRKLGNKVKQVNDLVVANASDQELLTNFEEARSLLLDITDLSK